MRLCNETLTLVHSIRTKNGETYTCTVIEAASWHAKTAVQKEDGGACAANTVRVRIPQECFDGVVAVGDFLVRGAVAKVESLDALAGAETCKIQSVSDNRRGLTPHWSVVGA